MRVAVGSGNPVKRAATERALGDDCTVVAEPVASGVAEQPRGEAETVEGARNRAERALAAGDYALGVGLEGGVARVESVDGLFLTMWAAVADGERVEYGAGPRLRLPERVAGQVEGGAELGPVMDEAYDMKNVAENEGAAGVLTSGRMDRTSALEHAVAGALGPFR